MYFSYINVSAPTNTKEAKGTDKNIKRPSPTTKKTFRMG
jgi:hypothetical protein